MDWNNINTDKDTSGLGPIEYDQSKVPSLIRKHADDVRTKTYGQEMREAQARNAELAGLIASEAVDISNETKGRQATVESQFNAVQQELTDKDPISAPEIIAARNGEATLNDRLDKEQQEVNEQLAQTVLLVPKLEVSIDDTNQLQNAINVASENSTNIKLSKNKVYIVESLEPRPNVEVDLNGSTLRLKNNADLPLFYDYMNTEIKSNFSIINGLLDCNMDNNSDEINQSAGVFWLSNWDNLVFKNLTIINAFRNAFNFYGVRNLLAENIIVKDCGKDNSNDFYSYGFSVESSARRSSNVVLKNFVCENMYGFGVHIIQTDKFDLTNLEFVDLHRKNDAIAITLTDATAGDLTNVTVKKKNKAHSIDAHAIEINSCKNVTLDNVRIDSARTTDIIFGDNYSSDISRNVKMSNVTTTNTGGKSLSLNYVEDLLIENSRFDKDYTTLFNLPHDRILFNNCVFDVPCNQLMTYKFFNYIHTQFTDLTIIDKRRVTGKINMRIVLNANDSRVVSLTPVAFEGTFIGDVDITTNGVGNAQGSYLSYLLFVYNNNVTNSGLNKEIIGSSSRKPTVTFSGDNMTLLNETGVTIIVNISFVNKSGL